MLVDSHCHLNMLDLSSFDNNMDNVISAAQSHDVSHMLCVSVDLNTLPEILSLAERYDSVTASVGLHPNDHPDYIVSQAELVQWAEHPKVVAIGETGLDYYRSEGDISWQQERFITHIQTAIETNLPLIVHTREAREDTLKLLRQHHAEKCGGVLHCFTENWAMAQAAMELGFYISMSGIVTFKNATELQEVAKKMPLDRLLVETDAPFLAPVPFRGKPNQPAYVKYVAEFVAELRGISYQALAQATTENFYKLFHGAKVND